MTSHSEIPRCSKYEGNMTIYMKKYKGICGKYEGICQKCEGIRSSRNMSTPILLDLALPYLYGSWDLEKFWAPLSYSLWGLEKFQMLPLYMGRGTWKNSTPELPPGLWAIFIPTSTYMEIGSGILSPASIQALGFEKMLSFLFLGLQPVGHRA